MTEQAKHVIESVDPVVLKWAFRQWVKNSVWIDSPEAVALALSPTRTALEIKAIAQGLRDLAKMPKGELPEWLQ